LEKEYREFLDQQARNADAMEPKLISSDPSWERREAVRSVLPKGAELAPEGRKTAYGAGNWLAGGSSLYGSSGSSSGQAYYHFQRPYLPELEDPSRQHYPIARVEANRYWRLFYKFDPVFGNVMDMYADMLWSDYDIILDEESVEIKDTVERMCRGVNLLQKLKQLTLEYLIIGEVFPHLFYDEDDKIWSYVGFHNPDYIDVKDAPIINMDPIMSFIPDDQLRGYLTDNSPESREFRARLPAEFTSKIMARQPIRLSPINCSMVARKLHPYDIRGTSIASRLFRVWMIEDAAANATIATYRRNAAPIRVVKLGNPQTGWIPSPGTESRLADLIRRAEVDPASVLIWNYGINFEAWGTNDRAVSALRDNDVIERIKLVALGVSKSFLTGEVTYAAASAGMQVFLRRLLALRHFIEQTWLYPKFFEPISIMNGWKKTKKSAPGDKAYRKTASDHYEEYIVPRIRWQNKLDASIDTEFLKAAQMLGQLGIKLSRGTLCSSVGIDFEQEYKKELKEAKDTKEWKDKILGKTLAEEYDQAAEGGDKAKPPGAPGSGAKPPAAGGDLAKKPDKAPGNNVKQTPLDTPINSPGEGGMSDTID